MGNLSEEDQNLPLNACPKCGSENISGGHFESDSDQVWQEVTCEDCGAVWVEYYNFAGYELEE